MSSDWRKYSLGDLFNVKHGYAFKGEFFCDEKTTELLVTPGNFSTNGGFQNIKQKYYNGPVPEEYVLSPGDLVVTMTDLSKEADTLGFGAIIPEDNNVWLHNQRVGLIELKDEALSDLGFLNYLLRSRNYRGWIIGSATGTTVKHTAPKKIHAFECFLPPLPEQKAIAQILGDLDDKIELNRKMNQTLEEMAQALFKSWFVDFDPVIDNALATGNEIPEAMQAKAEKRKLVREKADCRPSLPKEIQELFPDSFVFNEELNKWIPEGWEVAILSDLIEIQNGFAFKSKDFKDKGVPVLKIKNVKPNKVLYHSLDCVDESLANPKYIVNKGELLITMTGNRYDGSPDSWVGKVAMFDKNEPYLVNQRVAKIVSKTYLSNDFFLELLSSFDFQLYFINNSTSSGGQANISPDLIKNTPIHMPPEVIESVFFKMVKSYRNQIQRKNMQIDLLTALRITLLPQLISGKLRVPPGM